MKHELPMDADSFSFVIPAYNDAAGLRRHLEYFSNRAETIQLVIVDDASVDETEQVVASATLPPNVRITYHRQAHNAGPAAARNLGMTLAEGDFVMFLDADDVLAECFFTYVNLSALRNGADLVLFKYHLSTVPAHRYTYDMHRTDNTFFSRITGPGFPMGTFTLRDLPSALRIVNFPWNKIYRREFLKSAQIFFPDQRMHEDVLPHWQSLLRARTFGVLNWAPPLITHYETPGGNRATNYVGPLRLALFPSLKDLHSEISANALAEVLLPEFTAFCDEVFAWMTTVICAGKTAEANAWRVRYQKEIDDFRAFVDSCGEQKLLMPTPGSDEVAALAGGETR